MWHVGDCGVRVVEKMSKDIGMGVRKGTVVSFVPTLSIPICLFNVFCDLFPLLFFWGGGGGGGGQGYRAIDARYACMSYSGDRLR